MTEQTVVHFLNQFFAGIGGEDKADTPVGVREGALGPGRALQPLLPKGFNITATVFAGDNYFNEHPEEAKQQVLQAVKATSPKMLIAGPAFDNGRYGVACAEVCNLVAKELDIYSITAMYEENPGVDLYRFHKNMKVLLFPTSSAVAGMQDALATMGKFTAKVASGATIQDASQEGYIARGIRRVVVVDKIAAERGVELLLAKITGHPYTTEVPLKKLEAVTPARAIADVSEATLGLVTTAGLVPYGNPDKFKSLRNTQWRKYPIEGLSRLEKGKWEAVHGGYNVMFVNDNPDFGLPLDALRQLEQEKLFGRLHPYFYSTPGVQASVNVMQQIGRQMAQDMKDSGVDAVLLVSTWGSCSRSGAAITKEIERAGLPVAMITSMYGLSHQLGAPRTVIGTKIAHPCGNPSLTPEQDRLLRRKIVLMALKAVQTEVSEPTVFRPEITLVVG